MEVTLVGHDRVPDARVTITAENLEAREAEMRKAAQQFQIPSERWSGSLLYRQYHENGMNKLRLDPEQDCIERNYSYAMQWEDWLTVLLTQYYETGRLNIPDACQGSDLLLLLEYFGILYAPEQLVFASYAAYQRVRAWSDYLTQRSALADHVVNLLTMVSGHNGRVYQLGTVETSTEKLGHMPQQGRGEHSPIYSWGSDVADIVSQSHLQQQTIPTSRVIYNIFNMTKENRVAEALRDDFAVYLQNLLPANVSDVTFSVKMVQVRSGASPESYRGKRAILKLVIQPTYDEKSRAKSELSFPVDEVTANRQPSIYGSQAGQSRNRASGRPPLPPTAAADHVYRELEGEKAPLRSSKQSENIGHQRSLDPVMAGKSEGWNAPVDVVEPHDSATIASALTGPFAGGEDATIGDEDARAEALRQEWVQGSLLNRDIDDRMKELLHDKYTKEVPFKSREPGTPETTLSEESDSPRIAKSPSIDKGCHPWEWMNLVCADFLEPHMNKSSIFNQETKAAREVPAVEPVSASTPENAESPPIAQASSSPRNTFVVKAVASPEAKLTSALSQEEQLAKIKKPVITTHEGVKERLKELTEMRGDQLRIPKTPPKGVSQPPNTKTPQRMTMNGLPKETVEQPESMVKDQTAQSRKMGLFRGRQLKVVKKTHKKDTARASSTDAVAPRKNVSSSSSSNNNNNNKNDKKTTGFRKFFRR